METLWLWGGFNLFVLAMLAIDLGVFHRHAHTVSLKEAAAWSVVWITLALIFGGGIFMYYGHQAGLQFITGYLIEKALSVDNIFVFVLVFSYFRVPSEYQHRVLFWGVLGALIMRGAMILAGAVLIAKFHWILYIFGAFLVLTAIRMATHDEAAVEPEANPVIRLVRRFMPVSSNYAGQNFFTHIQNSHGKRVMAATPLFIVLVMVETTDLVFALDSIPAIFAITTDPFIVYTSNVFAILGLRALYFLLAGVIHKFHYLRLGLAIVLGFVGVKMLIADFYKIPIGLALGFVALVLVVSVVASLVFPAKTETAPGAAQPPSEVPRG